MPEVEWRDLRGLSFSDPFFDDTVRRALREPYRLLFAARTPIDELGRVAGAVPSVPPSGFIFHASRCGSTLISNMLGALDDTIVASEPPVVDGVLRADLHGDVSDETRRRWLGWVLHALGQPRSGGERRFFVKLDAWSTRDMALVRAAYPRVPCLFVYREPAEIVAAHMRMRGAHTVPGLLPPELFGLASHDVCAARPEEFCARVVGSILQAAGEQLAPGCRLVHYRQLPAIVADELVEHLGVAPTSEEQARLRDVARLDAKNPRLPYSPAGHPGAVTATIRAAADEWASAAYERLEACRARDGELIAR